MSENSECVEAVTRRKSNPKKQKIEKLSYTMHESLKKLLKEILSNSLAQAIIKIIFTQNLALKLFLIAFVLSASCLAAFLVIQAILAYLSYQILTVSRNIYENPTLFPKVTFCNLQPLISEYAFNFTEHGIGDSDILNLSDEEKKRLGHDLEDILIDCNFNNKHCASTDFSWSYDKVYGNCYTFNTGFSLNGSKIDLKKSSLTGPQFGLQLELYVNFYEKLSFKAPTLGALLRLGNSSYLTFNSDQSGILLTPGFQTNIAVEREFKTILSKPYSQCEVDSNTPAFIQGSDLYNLIGESNYAYSQELCLIQCRQKKYVDKYNCTYPDFLSLFNVITCSMDLLDDTYDINVILNECLPLCPLECNQTLFKTSISLSQLNGEYALSIFRPKFVSDFINRTIDSIKARESIVKVNIFYESLFYTESYEWPQMNAVSLFASIGGNLGLFLGVSVFSICEIVEFIIVMFFLYIEKKKSFTANSLQTN